MNEKEPNGGELLDALVVSIETLWTREEERDLADEEAFEENIRTEALGLVERLKTETDAEKRNAILDQLETEVAHYEENLGDRAFDTTRQVAKKEHLETIGELRRIFG